MASGRWHFAMGCNNPMGAGMRHGKLSHGLHLRGSTMSLSQRGRRSTHTP